MINRFYALLAGLSTICLVTACVREYQPDTVSVPPALVVEGQITDQSGPYSVRLTRTADYTLRSINLLETGATVTIQDNLGNRETLREQSPGGTYVSRADGIRGVAGRRYKVIIQTKAGNRYESTEEVLSAAPPIQKLYSEYQPNTTPGTGLRRQGWSVYIDTKDPETPGDYYRWEWTNYTFTDVCRKTLAPGGTSYTGISCCSPCWNINRCYNCIDVNSDVNINGQAISRQLITQVPYTSKNRYYIEVQQQALSQGAYQYWKSVRQLVNNTGGLFDAAPSTVQTNIRCVSDPATAVYGYFGATGISEQYIYVDRSEGQGIPELDLPVNIPYPTQPPCVACENTIYQTSEKPRWWVY